MQLLYDKRHEDALAMSNYETALSFHEPMAEAHFRKALLLRLFKQHQDSLKHLLRATQLAPHMAAYWFELGQTYQVHLSSPELAEAPYRETLLLNPNHPFVYFYLGQVVKDDSVRQFYFVKARELNSHHLGMLKELARLQKTSNMHSAESVKTLKQALALSPYSVEIRSQLICALQDSSDTDMELEIKKLYIAWEKSGKVEECFERQQFEIAPFQVVVKEYFELKGTTSHGQHKWIFHVQNTKTHEELVISLGTYVFSNRLMGKKIFYLDKYSDEQCTHETYGMFNATAQGLPSCSYDNVRQLVKDILLGKLQYISSSFHSALANT